MKSLRITMYVITAYLTIIGALYLFFPGAAETAFKITLSDRGTAMLHGFGNLVIAYLAFMTASKLDMYRNLVRVFQVFALGETLIFVYQLTSGMYTFAEVGPPTIIWALFTVSLFVFGRNQ